MVKDFRDRKGWVANRLLAENNTVILKISKGNLRSGPSSAGAIVEEIEYGTILWIEEIQEDWLKIINKDGVEGWLPRLSVWPE